MVQVWFTSLLPTILASPRMTDQVPGDAFDCDATGTFRVSSDCTFYFTVICRRWGQERSSEVWPWIQCGSVIARKNIYHRYLSKVNNFRRSSKQLYKAFMLKISIHHRIWRIVIPNSNLKKKKIYSKEWKKMFFFNIFYMEQMEYVVLVVISRATDTLSLICAWTNGWVNNREAGELRRHRAHYYVTVMQLHIYMWHLIFQWYAVIVVSGHKSLQWPPSWVKCTRVTSHLSQAMIT